MVDIKKQMEKVERQQEELLSQLESEIIEKISEVVALLKVKPDRLEFSDEVAFSVQDLNGTCRTMGIGDVSERTKAGRRRVSGKEKMRHLRDWIAHSDGEFTHRKLCEAFAPLNNGRTAQRTFYLEQLQQLIDEGIIEEERIGEGERPRIVFRRATSPDRKAGATDN